MEMVLLSVLVFAIVGGVISTIILVSATKIAKRADKLTGIISRSKRE